MDIFLGWSSSSQVISACENGKKWQEALRFLLDAEEQLKTTRTSYNVGWKNGWHFGFYEKLIVFDGDFMVLDGVVVI